MLLQTPTATVYYDVHGPSDAPAVLCSHGVAMDHRTFDAQVRALKQQYRVIVWDMPYHGRSSAIDKSLPFSRTAADLSVGILDELGIREAVHVGLSLGSLVAQKAAHYHPDRFRALVHVGGSPLHPRYPSILRAAEPLVHAILKLYPVDAMNRTFAEHKALSEETKAYLMETLPATGVDAIIHLNKEMLRDMVEGLPEYNRQPALIVYGDHEVGFVRKKCRTWHAALPDSRLVVIPDAHHITNQDNPEAFNEVLLSFLDEVCQVA